MLLTSKLWLRTLLISGSFLLVFSNTTIAQTDAYMDSMFQVFDDNFYVNYAKCDTIIDEAIAYIEANENPSAYEKDLQLWIFNKAVIARALGNYETQEKYLFDALGLMDWSSEENISLKLKIKNSLGNLYTVKGEQLKALDCYIFILKKCINKDIKDLDKKSRRDIVCSAYNGLGAINMDVGNFEIAEKYFKKALKVAGGINNESSKYLGVYMQANIAMSIMHQQKDYDEVIGYLKRVFTLGQEIDLDPCSLYYIKLNEASCWSLLGEVKKYQEAIQSIEQNMDDTKCLGVFYTTVRARFALKHKDYDYLETLLSPYDSIAVDSIVENSQDSDDFLNVLQEYYKAIGEHDKAYRYLNIQASSISLDNELVYQVRRRTKELEAEELKSKSKQTAPKKSNVSSQYLWWGIPGGIVVVSLIFWFVYRKRKSPQPTEPEAIVEEKPVKKHIDYSTVVPKRILTDMEHAEFKQSFNKKFPRFIEQLNAQYPNLSLGDEKLILLMYLRLGYKEIALILGISDQSVRKKQLRLKKKLNLEDQVSLENFVFDLEETL